MRTTGGSPNVINGVSRQPPEVRLTSQLQESVNQFPTVTRGLVPRNPARLRGVIPTIGPEVAVEHLIDRDAVEQYNVTLTPVGVTVHKLDGTKINVNAPSGWEYLNGAGPNDLTALTVQDHTFILNRRKVVGKMGSLTPSARSEGLVHIVQGDYFTEYKVIVNGNVAGHYITDGGPHSDPEASREAERGARTGYIAQALVTGSTPAGVPSRPSTALVNLRQSLDPAEWGIQLIDNVIYIVNQKGNSFTLEVEAGSETRIRAHKGESQDFAKLPAKARAGFLLKINGSEDTAYDDYYVRYGKASDSAQGTWKEDHAPATQYRLDPATMPHLLVREANGNFTFKRAEWADRKVGDDDTNPWPSFVGQKINGIAFGNNRLGFHSGESFAQSRHGDFFNFFIESILTPLDTDPVDAAISYPEVSTINHIVPFSGEILLFTESVPFRLEKGETLTQKNAHYEHLLSNKVSAKVRPVAAGSKLYFVNDTPTGCFVHEFSYDRSVDNLTAQSITDHVSGYVPPGITMMAADGDLKMLMLVSEKEPNSIYVYKWLWIGSEKVQSAWQKWTLDAPIKAMRFYQEELVVVTQRSSTREILGINCHEAFTQNGPCPAYLDRQVSRQGSYDAATDTTSFNLPYPAAGAMAVMVDPRIFGMAPTIARATGNTLVVNGHYGGNTARIGFPYESYGILSELLHRSTNQNGSYGNALPGFQTTISSLRFGTGETAFMRVELERDYRKPYVYDFAAALVGTKTGLHGSLILGEIAKPVAIMSRSTDFRLKFGSNGPYPYSVLSYAWTGDARQISY